MITDEELGRLKAIPRSFRKPLPSEEEAREVEGSLYHMWWRCLRASSKYLECCEVEGRNHALSQTYANFGDVRVKWPIWWRRTGRVIFSERHDYPKVRAITKDRALTKLNVESESFLILDVPLGLRRTTVLEQINKLLDEHHPGRDLDVWAQSTAKVKLHKSKLHEKTLPQLVLVAEILHKKPEILLYELAEVAGLAEIHLGRSVQEELTKREEHQRREMAASRYKDQANKLVINAAHGRFPCID
ncbi:hypothetical protein [Limnohabitans sp. INBF002]|uniref:hypothetical protein n=1 Tax=Limnohabitans sp. INBF002 TaxID=2986280 RepID=UPI002377B1D2|nr:hypothetical protein [Limnohabitans sp. INBF002]BDU53386.1 hypothetical protein LINBF2_16210 [Limnohabitans sp. INBF002]